MPKVNWRKYQAHAERIAGEILALEITQDEGLEIPKTKGDAIALGMKLIAVK